MSRVRVCVGYFHPWTNDVGVLLAQHEGWFLEQGLDVECVIPDPYRGRPCHYLERAEADFALVPLSRLLTARERSAPIVGVAAVNHRGLDAVQTVAGTGVTRPRDLAGRRVGLNPTPRGVAMVRYLVERDGGDPDAVIMVDCGCRELTADDIRGGEVDATFGGYWAWDALFSTVPADEHLIWPVDTLGVPAFHSYVLATREALVRERPDVVGAVVEVAGRGYRTAVEDRPLTLAVLERVTPYFPRRMLARSLELVAPTWLYEGQWGRLREELIGPYARWLASRGLLHRPESWNEAVTNRFVTAGQLTL